MHHLHWVISEGSIGAFRRILEHLFKWKTNKTRHLGLTVMNYQFAFGILYLYRQRWNLSDVIQIKSKNFVIWLVYSRLFIFMQERLLISSSVLYLQWEICFGDVNISTYTQNILIATRQSFRTLKSLQHYNSTTVIIWNSHQFECSIQIFNFNRLKKNSEKFPQ